MPLTIDRFEGDAGELLTVPRAHIPPEAKEGDVLLELNGGPADGPVRYVVDEGATERRRREAEELRASLLPAPEGDLEL